MRRREIAGRLHALAFNAPLPPYRFASSPPDARTGHVAMRGLAMAADGGIELSPGTITGITGVIGAAVGGFCLWLAQRLVGKAAWETALNAKFSELLKRTEEFHARKEAAWEVERLQLRGEIVNLKQTIASLASTLRRQGVLDVPEDKFGTDALIQLPGTEDEA
jgi:hypothetical protein